MVAVKLSPQVSVSGQQSSRQSKKVQWFAGCFGSSAQRRGAIVVLSSILMLMLAGMVALSVDLGYVYTIQTELKRATDAAALAGAGALIEGPEAAYFRAADFLLRNPVGSRILIEDENRTQRIEQWLAEHPDEFECAVGHWNPTTRTFTESTDLPSTVRVVTAYRAAPLFFARVFGYDQVEVRAESIARYQPRDIVLVLDFSASMNDDSELRRISEFGEQWRPCVEESLYQIWQDLGSPEYGTLPFAPDYVTLVGLAPTRGCQPQIHVKFLEYERKVWVQSTLELSNVVVQYSDGSRVRFDNLCGTSGTFGSGSKQIERVWVKSGCNESGEGPGYGERFERSWTNDNARIKSWFGLTCVPYPYPSGSWDEYINYVKSSSYIHAAKYRKKYGLMTLINYWLEQKPKFSETPDLWRTSAEPVYSLKQAVEVFVEHLGRVDCGDRLALAIYNSSSGWGLLEHPFTDDYSVISSIVQQRQAGHYDRYTNIGAGIQQGWMHLDAQGRAGAKRIILLMTDGWANRPPSNPRGFALEQAQIAASKNYTIMTVSFSIEADTELMEEIAQMTGGEHFNVPGGSSVQEYREELISVFRRLADDRPLVLVK